MPFDYTNIAAIAQKKQQLLSSAQCFTAMFYGLNAEENSLTEMDALRAYLFLSLHHNKVAQKSNTLLIKLLNASYGDVKNVHAETMSSMTEEDFNSLFKGNPEVREYLIVFKDVFQVVENGLREETKEAITHQYDALKKGWLLYELQQWLKTAENTNKRIIVEQILIPHLKGLQSGVLDASLLLPLWSVLEKVAHDIFSFFNSEIIHLSEQEHFSPLTLPFDEPEQIIDYDRWSMLTYCYDHYYHRVEASESDSEDEKKDNKAKYAGKIAALSLVIKWFREPDQFERNFENMSRLNLPNFLTYLLDTFCSPEELGCYRTQIDKMQKASSLFHELLVPRLWNDAKNRREMEIALSSYTHNSSLNNSPVPSQKSNMNDGDDGYHLIDIDIETASLTTSSLKSESPVWKKPALSRTVSWNFSVFINRNTQDKSPKNSPDKTLKKTSSTSKLNSPGRS